jgi:ribosome-associated translation inhibitor RaiA
MRSTPPNRKPAPSSPTVRRRPQRAGNAPGRAHARQPDSPSRSPFPGWLPKPIKREPAGRDQTPSIPAYIRASGVEFGREDQDYVRRKLGTKLGKFADAIERVSVRVEDVNGPRGGVDQSCRIKVVLSGLPSVVFAHQDASLRAAVDGALSGVERTVRRTLRRHRTKSMKTAA